MSRLQLRRPAGLGRRPLRARRLAVAHDLPMEYSTQRPTPAWLVVGTGALAAAVLVELAVGLIVVFT